MTAAEHWTSIVGPLVPEEVMDLPVVRRWDGTHEDMPDVAIFSAGSPRDRMLIVRQPDHPSQSLYRFINIETSIDTLAVGTSALTSRLLRYLRGNGYTAIVWDGQAPTRIPNPAGFGYYGQPLDEIEF